MPAKNRTPKPSKKTAKKATKKAAKKAAKTVASKAAKKVAKKAANKVAKKPSKKAARKVAGKAPQRPQKVRQRTAAIPAVSRHKMIAEAAYYRAARRGFCAGDAVADWLSSEREIDEMLNKG